MASGFPGGGDGGAGGELNSRIGIPGGSYNYTNPNPNPNPFPFPLQRHHHLPRIFLDQPNPPPPPPPPYLLRNPIPQRFDQPTGSLIGKRTLAEFQAAQHQHSNLLMLRSVKARLGMAAPVSTLNSSNLSSPNPPMIAANPAIDVNKKLRELEKQLLDDDEDDGLALTSLLHNSEWSELIAPTVPKPPPQKPIERSLSPPASSSSLSPSSTVTNSVPPAITMQSLLEIAEAISEFRNDGVLEILSRCPAQPNLTANPEQKLIGFLAGALKSRVNPKDNPPPVKELYSREHFESTRSLYEVSPCFWLGFMAANLAIVHAAKGRDAVHVIDFDAGNCGGIQYVNLLQALSSARGKAPSLLKLTAVHNMEEDRLKEVSEGLTRVAERVGVRFRFNSVELRKIGGLTELTRASLGVDEDEAVAVNLAFNLYRIPDESVYLENPRDELLRRARGLSPLVVTVAEHEMNVNTAPFLPRVRDTCEYYGALLESIDATIMKGSGEREKAEAGIGQRLANTVACEGKERVERCEVFGKWRARLGMAGFKPLHMGPEVALSLRKRVNPGGGRVNPGFMVTEDAGAVLIGWKGKTLTVASAWR